VVVELRDDGEGIDPTSLPNIFDMFFQRPRPVDRAEGGLGLGLTLVKRLVACTVVRLRQQVRAQDKEVNSP
jgi:signal transduction histidine kinase